MAEEAQTEMERQLAALKIQPEDVGAAVKLLAATARGERETVYVWSGSGSDMIPRAVLPLPSGETVQKLAERLASTERQLKETNEKLDRVLAALEKK